MGCWLSSGGVPGDLLEPLEFGSEFGFDGGEASHFEVGVVEEADDAAEFAGEEVAAQAAPLLTFSGTVSSPSAVL